MPLTRTVHLSAPPSAAADLADYARRVARAHLDIECWLDNGYTMSLPHFGVGLRAGDVTYTLVRSC